jgi:hypothetical protein
MALERERRACEGFVAKAFTFCCTEPMQDATAIEEDTPAIDNSQGVRARLAPAAHESGLRRHGGGGRTHQRQKGIHPRVDACVLGPIHRRTSVAATDAGTPTAKGAFESCRVQIENANWHDQ